MYSCFHCKTKHDRCFFWFLAAMLVPIWMGTNIASPCKALYIWENHFSEYLAMKNKIALTWISARIWGYLSPFISQILNSLLNSSDFYFWWRDSENQQLFNNSNELSRMSGHPWSMKKVSITRAGHIWNAKIQSLFGSWEKQGFVKVAIRRAVCFWEYPLGELSL